MKGNAVAAFGEVISLALLPVPLSPFGSRFAGSVNIIRKDNAGFHVQRRLADTEL